MPKRDVAPRIEPVAPQAALPVVAPPRAALQDEPRPKIEPLSATRYRIEATVSAEAKEVIEDIKNLMAHRNPTRDLGIILEAALREYRATLQKERLCQTSRPKKKTGADEKAIDQSCAPKKKTRPGYIPRPVRREVFERDGAQCSYVDAEGRRCQERGCLELHHLVSKAVGGADTAENITVRCRAHNLRDAEQVFGRAYVEERIHLERSKCQAKHQAARSVAFEAAGRGLVKDLGFRERDVRRALAKVAEEVDPTTATAETLVRAALRLLT